jgi:hypothetical protein
MSDAVRLPQLTAPEKAFLEEASAFLTERGLLRPTRASAIIAGLFFFQLERHMLG